MMTLPLSLTIGTLTLAKCTKFAFLCKKNEFLLVRGIQIDIIRDLYTFRIYWSPIIIKIMNGENITIAKE